MEFETFQDIMTYAIEKEKEAASFYEKLSEQETFSGIREVFKEFATEERKHEAMLQKFTKEGLAEYKIEKVPDLKRSEYLVDVEYTPGMSYTDVLRLAAKREEKSRKLYHDFGQKTHKEDHKALFKMLAQEEARHKLRLETMLDDYLAKMGD